MRLFNQTLKVLTVIMLVSFAAQSFAQQPELQYYRPWDKTGINTFEPSKKAEQPAYTGFKIRIGGSFTQDYQSLEHSNTPTYKAVSATDARNTNYLYGVATNNVVGGKNTWLLNAGDSTTAKLSGFNLAMANLNLDFQIEDGIRVCLENYMSSRHHSEFWVKGGYIQIDKLPMFGNPQWFSDYLRVKIGHFQPNFGDMQFRRTDGGNTMYNPFVENLILDAFSTEIGGEVYVFPTNNFMLMAGMTSGFINGNVEKYAEVPVGSNKEAIKKNPSVFFKAAFDKQFENDFRFRLSASMYNNSSIQRNTLYAGDRTGSHYFLVMEPALQSGGTATAQASQFTSGRLNPNIANKLNSIVINPFIKFKGLEFFGSYEMLKGKNYSEEDEREFTQIAAELLYRIGAKENVYVGGRYVQVEGRLAGFANDIKIDRTAIAAGWFPSKNLLLKGEYVIQNYKDFPNTDYRYEGKFNGFFVQAVIGF
ncbi:MAG: hypothetical protein SFU99_06780 [Saprospiraceae bacterium]|nr:hypothetical protein [Saprospiraceae bacterium]